MHLEHPEIEERFLLSKGHRYDLKTNVFNKLQNIVFFEEKPINGEEYIQIYGRKDNERKYMWIKKKYIQGSKNFNKYKVILSASNGSGAIGEALLSTPLIGKPQIGHTQTFLTIGCFDSEDEALNCLRFIKTKFARVMLGALKITQHNSKETWRYVPQQNFCINSDIDWAKSINEIDVQLYRKYNLTEDEKEFIESNVKPMYD